MSLRDYGWCEHLSLAFEALKRPGYSAGRVIRVDREVFTVATDQEAIAARVCGKLREADSQDSCPVIGDWVALTGNGGTHLIQAILPRTSLLVRKQPGNRVEQQAIAANVDTAFLVMGLDQNFNVRRLERMLTVTYECGAVPVIVLTKLDLTNDLPAQQAAVEIAAPGAPILAVSSRTGQGMELFERFLSPGRTVVFLGSSGVGKSTLINRFFGVDMLATGEVRASDGRGRHTTTHRQMFRHPSGALLIDNPGIRELQLWCSEEALQQSFQDVEELANRCHFRDCSHSSEPRCAVRAAVTNGTLAPERLESFLKLRRELRYLAIKQDEGAQRAERQRWKAIHKAARHNPKS